eukprot:scaffold34_cov337-Pavlova_lutheri.AAC.9
MRQSMSISRPKISMNPRHARGSRDRNRPQGLFYSNDSTTKPVMEGPPIRVDGTASVSLWDPWSLGWTSPDVAPPIEVIEHSVLRGLYRWTPTWFGPCKRREARARPRAFRGWILPRFP